MNAITMRRTVISFARISLLLLFAAFTGVSNAPAQIVSITVAPPELPVYDQPPIPGPGYIWTPGYWAWGDGDYYWVPGTWVEPPEVGVLWTPGYWAFNDDGIYVWNAGYWGPHVGFYGGCNYGFGYVGVGYEGGFWRGGVFSYNRTVNNFGSVNITNVYNKTVVVNNVTNVSYNGGAGGLTSRPNQRELAAATERHVAATGLQTQHQQRASTNRDMRASVNGGKPAVAATTHAGRFQGTGVVAAHHDGGAAGGAGHSSPGGGHSPTGLNTRPRHGVNTPQGTNASLNNTHSGGNGQRVPSATGRQPGVQSVRPSTPVVGGGTPHPGNVTSTRPGFAGGIQTGGPPGGFRPGVGNPPRVSNANVARPMAPAMRPPPPRGPVQQHQQQHH
jgi:hypothetical protein